MHLYELFTPSHLPITGKEAIDALSVPAAEDQGFKEFEGLLRDKGFKLLGHGQYGTVFTHPSLPYAIKVFSDAGGYSTFVNYCTNNSHNEHLPKFRGKIIRINEDYAFCRLEILTSVSTQQAAMMDDISNIVSTTGKSLNWRRLMDCFDSSYAEHGFTESMFQTIVSLARISYVHYDLHGENIMRRGDTIVIIDPFTG